MSPTASPPASVSPTQSQTEDQQHHGQHDDTLELSQQSIGADTSFSSSDGANAKHPRAKRKRTSAHDRLVLEEAYQRDSKPEKFARLEIVSMTTMTEKEVQVWFQNRRQNDRRRSKPLTEQELANLQNYGIRPVADVWRGVISPLKVMQNPVAVSDPIQAPTASPTEQQQSGPESGHARSFSDAGTSYSRPVAVAGSQESLPSPNELSKSFPNVGYLSNRRREAPSLSTPGPRASTGSYEEFSFSVERSNASPSAPHLYHGSVTPTNSQSQMRLSCSIDGKAELIPHQQPSPPQTQPQPPLLRSYSANAVPPSSSPSESVKLPPISSMLSQAPAAPAAPPRLGRGRSRTAQAWESCATAETRDELTAMAENESNGSAAASISLIRSASNNALQPSSGAKRNASLARQRPQQAKRTKLARTTSSVGRLETTAKKSGLPTTSLIATSGADSDKENLSPDEDGNPQPRRRPLPSGRAPLPSSTAGNARRRGVLQEGREARPSLLNSRANTAPLRRDRGGKDVTIFEDDGGEKENSAVDDDVERFMSRASVSPGKKGEMEVAAVLSSLKGASWAPVNALR